MQTKNFWENNYLPKYKVCIEENHMNIVVPKNSTKCFLVESEYTYAKKFCGIFLDFRRVKWFMRKKGGNFVARISIEVCAFKETQKVLKLVKTMQTYSNSYRGL